MIETVLNFIAEYGWYYVRLGSIPWLCCMLYEIGMGSTRFTSLPKLMVFHFLTWWLTVISIVGYYMYQYVGGFTSWLREWIDD